MDNYEKLLTEMPKIAKAVNEFSSDVVQQNAFRSLIDAFLGEERGDAVAPAVGHDDRPAGKGTKTARKRAHGPEAENAQSPSASDGANELVNRMKQRADFAVLTEKVIHERDLWNKIRLVLFLADGAMTSGEIQAVLAGLNLKTDVPAVSKKLKAKHASLVSSGPRKKGTVARYKLSGPARSETEKWVNGLRK